MDNWGIFQAQWAFSALDGLSKAGVRTVCAAPGFRNSPLILAAKTNPNIRCELAVDERGLAFFALGIAKSTSTPVVVLCTSGTAAANLHPAILEAYYDDVPLIVITADRPHELIGSGANQTMDQMHLFGKHVRFFQNIPVPETFSDFQYRFLAQMMNKAYCFSMGPSPGPVHINMSFREPLLPESEQEFSLPSHTYDDFPFSPTLAICPKRAKEAATLMSSSKNPVFLLGPGHYTEDFFQVIVRMGEALSCPVIAEAASGLPFSYAAQKTKNIIIANDSTIKPLTQIFSPDLLVRFGRPMTSKLFQTWDNKNIKTLLFDRGTEVRNPSYSPSMHFNGPLEGWGKEVLRYLPTVKNPLGWKEELSQGIQQETQKINASISKQTKLTEWFISNYLSCNNEHTTANLFLGNSMPIRDFNSTCTRYGIKKMRIFHNRGLSGIDGILSTAMGVALNKGQQEKTTLLYGDLSALHDLNAFALLKKMESRLNMTVILINNNGGEIFRQVATNYPEDWFVLPMEIDFQKIIQGFGLAYYKTDCPKDFARAVNSDGVQVIEAICSSPHNQSVRNI